MSEVVLLNKHQKKALVIKLYKQGKTRRQIAEVVHMSFKDISDIINEYTGEDKQVHKLDKSKDSHAFELFLQGKQSVEVAIDCSRHACRQGRRATCSILGTIKFRQLGYNVL
jgi:transposase